MIVSAVGTVMPNRYSALVTLRARPGARLLELLRERDLELADFARLLDPEVTDIRGAVANLRQYTHSQDPVWPKPEKVEAWAAALDVDPSAFFSAS